jgi:dihydroorotate dehydrogenase electron transfer subunit
VLGFRDPGSILLADAFRSLSSRLIVASETGGADIKGTAISALEMPGLLPDKAGLTIFSCGPVGLLSAVASFAGQMNIPAQVSLETRMGCGVGICRCCPVPVGKKTEDGAVEIADYERCCVEGPVFDAAEIVFEELING